MARLTPGLKRIAGESAWVFAGQIVSALGTLAGFRIITEVVPPAVYGSVVLSIGLIALGQGLAVQPLMQAVLRHYPEYAKDGGVALLRRTAVNALRRPVLWLSGGLALVLAIWSGYTQQGFLLGPLCGLLFLVEVVRTVEVFFLSAEREQRTIAWFVAADAWSRPLFGFAAVSILGAHSASVVGGYLAGSLLSLLGFYLLRRGGTTTVTQPPFVLEDAAAIRKRLWVYAMPLLLLPLIGWVSGQADRYIVGGFVGLQYAGLYAAIYGIASRPFLLVRDGVDLALRQVFYTQFSEGNRAGQRRVFLLWLASVSGAALLGLLAIALLHRQIAGLLLAAEYRAYSS
ncbi:MAG TPA: hypothetical protein VIK32_08625, partial [Candidatus Limnocylindrales bacterium]